jgi:hypothetical protein
MQIRYPTDLTLKEYIEQKAWEQAKLEHCPFHPEGGCGFARHGTYPRKFPEYCLIARWHCLKAHQTIGLLPDFFSSRFPGTLDEVEKTVNDAQKHKTQEDAAEFLRPDITLPSGLRWLRRRIKYVKEALTTFAGLLLPGCPPDLAFFRHRYATDRVLVRLRDIAGDLLTSLPPIVGLGPRRQARYCRSPVSNN